MRAPIDGVILPRHMKSGESVSDRRETPIVTMADIFKLRVRMDVDEADVCRLPIGQRVYVTAEAFAGEKFHGRVVRIGQILGKKNVHTDEPSERVDAKILEILIALEAGRKLAPGFRVDSFITPSAN